MSRSFDNFDDLFGFIENAVEDSLKKEVANKTKKTLSKQAHETVYSHPYDVNLYRRKKNRGGLSDTSLMSSNVTKKGNHQTLAVRSEREDKGRDVARIVEYGMGYNWHESRYAIMEREGIPIPRPFHYEAFKEMESTLSHVQAMIDGLNRQGIRVTK